MKALLRPYRFLNTVSIDISLGAVASSLFFSKVMHAEVRPIAYLALGLTVWIVYTMDHLLDVKRLTTRASTQRHEFHQKHFYVLSAILGMVLIIDGYAVLSIRRSLFFAGLLLSLVILFYLLFQRYLSPLKEFFGGILYTAGVILPAIVFGEKINSLAHQLLVVQFFFVVCMNLLLFSMFDKNHDEASNYISFATTMGEVRTRVTVLILFSLSILVGIYQVIYHDWCPAMVPLLMSIILFTILLMRKKFIDHELFRLVGDAVFILPILYFLCG
ncbi:MAG TPA: UbiA family prenyltransferase [Cyclobacteriaceae bacterium]|nr:UbiA family prenyltransferase [Cyclobacteriaceae bacterium]